MADQLATLSDLAAHPALAGQTIADATATLLLECATAVVQEAADGQRIVQVVGDTLSLTGLSGSWLDLPQIPVTAVASVTLDGVTLTAGAAGSGGSTYRLRGDRLWRGTGWQSHFGEPSDVAVVCTHGYPAGSQSLQLARSSVLALVVGVLGTPNGATQVRIDDYAATYDAMTVQMQASPTLRAAIKRTYARRAGIVRIG